MVESQLAIHLPTQKYKKLCWHFHLAIHKDAMSGCNNKGLPSLSSMRIVALDMSGWMVNTEGCPGGADSWRLMVSMPSIKVSIKMVTNRYWGLLLVGENCKSSVVA